MHLKALLVVGSATASLLAGTAGTALIGHAATAPAKHHTTVHHVSNTNHSGGAKGNKGSKGNTVVHHHKNISGTGGKGKGKGTPHP
jgi:hypothetical protein